MGIKETCRYETTDSTINSKWGEGGGVKIGKCSQFCLKWTDTIEEKIMLYSKFNKSARKKIKYHWS